MTQKKKIDPIAVITIALKQIKNRADYNRIVAANKQADFDAAWNTLSSDDRQRICRLTDAMSHPDLNEIAAEITACDNILQLQALKSEYGDDTVRSAWKLISVEERRRLKTICEGQSEPQPQPQPKTRTLFSIGDDLQRLNELLDETEGDVAQQELITQWLEHLDEERDRKLDGYAALITEMIARAEVRKAEAKRLMELAQGDENRAKLLKDRLKCFFETHKLKTVETTRYRLSLAKNGGKAPLILKDGISPTQLPERFQKLSIDPNIATIREALERGEPLDFASLGERGSSIRIK